jgi:hypothetical protein
VAVCALAAAELMAARAGGRIPGGAVPAVRVDDGAVAAAFASERLLRIDGRAPGTFASLSRFWPTAGGWVRTHANYPHHRARLLAALGVRDGGGEPAIAGRVAAELAGREAEEVQETVYAAGGLAVAVRAPTAWAAHPQGAAVAGQPLVHRERIGEGPSRWPVASPAAPYPAAGLRVLDLTRVIAGPVATRMLALLGADVLRIDATHLPESEDAYADTGFGKRSTVLDLADRGDRAVFEELLASADIVVTGYRPGALDRHGLAPEALAERRPGLVVAQLSAWGTHGPWAGRRGFDSLVQAACGIAAIEAGPDGRPGALPVQALDHGTGYLLAAAILRAVTESRASGGTRLTRLSLARTASWLLDGVATDRGGPPGTDAAGRTYGKGGTHGAEGGEARITAADGRTGGHGRSDATGRAAGIGEPCAVVADPAGHAPGRWLTERTGPIGRIRYALPPIAFDGGPADWTRPPGRLGTDAPVWRPAG